MISIPFPGNKKTSYKYVREIIEKGNYINSFEPFGGSGVLSVNLFNDNILKDVYLNDYDRLFDDYEEFLDIKDFVVSEGFKRGLKQSKRDKKGCYTINDKGEKVYRHSESLNEEERKILQSIIKNVDKKFWRLLSFGCNFCFGKIQSHREVRLVDFTIFTRGLSSENQRKYLKIVNKMNRDCLDWKNFLDKHKSKINKDSIVILDPPYIDTKQVQYKGSITEKETIELLKYVKSLGCDFIFFNNDLEKVKEWLDSLDLDYEFDHINSTCNSEKYNRRDVMAFVRNKDNEQR